MKKLKGLLKLFVMMSIRTPEEVYKTSAKSVGLDIANMDSGEVAAWKAVHKGIEAEYMIRNAFNTEPLTGEHIDKISTDLAKRIS